MKNYAEQYILCSGDQFKEKLVVKEAIVDYANQITQAITPIDTFNLLFALGGLIVILENLKEEYMEEYVLALEAVSDIKADIKFIQLKVKKEK